MAFALSDLIFPPRCVCCHAYLDHGRALCADCRRRIVLHRTYFCGKCRARRYSLRGICHSGFPFCLAAAGEYEDPVLKQLIRALKFHFMRAAAGPLGAVLGAYCARLRVPRSYGVVMPVPLSGRRARERGFNQSELIARAAAVQMSVSMDTSILIRARHAAPQSGLVGARARHANIAGSFRVRSPDKVRGRDIILLDDVVTSGATMLEAALALRAAGARNILALAVAKA